MQGANQLQQTVNRQVFSFSEYTEVLCNFNNYKEKVKFFLVNSLPHPFLFGYPFFRKQGAQFDLRNQCMVTLSSIPQSPTIRLSKLSTSGSEQDTISLFTGHNALFCTFKQDYSEDEAQEKLKELLTEYKSIFNPADKTPINAPKIDIPLKEEFRNKIFFCPEPLRSQHDQEIIDRNAEQLILDGRAYFNPSSHVPQHWSSNCTSP